MARRILGGVVAGLGLLSMTGSAQVVLPSIAVPRHIGVPSPPSRLIGLPRRDETLPSRPDARSAGDAQPSRDRGARSGPAGTSHTTQVPGGDLFLAGPDTYAPRHDRTSTPSRHRLRIPPKYGHIGSDFVPSSPVIPFSTARVADIEPSGYLRLLVQPGAAQVFVDGLYVGTVDDFRDANPRRSLEAGPHRVDIRAPGFETVTFDVRILENDTITYRRNLRTVDDTPEPARARVPAAAPRTFYVIPGCYAGDTPPRPARLPPGCDAANVQTVPPETGIVATGQRL